MFNDATILALSKLIADKQAKDARSKLGPGHHDIDLTVRIKGSMSIGEDYEKAPTVSIPLLAVLALFAKRAGVTKESSLNLIRECMVEALSTANKGADVLAAEVEGLEIMVKEIQQEVIAKLPKTISKGVVKTKLEVKPVEESIKAPAEIKRIEESLPV